MRLNNKGFAISSMMYSILLLFLMLVLGVLAILGSRKVILDKIKNDVVTDLTKNQSYVFSFEHQNILLSNNATVNGVNFSLLDGVKLVDQNGSVIETTIDVNSEPAFDATQNGLYQITYTATYQGYPVEARRTIEVVDPITYEFAYTGGEQQFVVPVNGTYRIELWGAQGGDITGTAYSSDGTVRANSQTYTGGRGAYTSGNIHLDLGEKLYLHVGGASEKTNTSLSSANGTYVGGYNGGASLSVGQQAYGAPGGGSTDVRLNSGVWNNFDGLKSRIMVAAGGGGANFRNQGYGEGNGGAGGTLTGVNGHEALTPGSYHRPGWAAGYEIGTGATQTQGGHIIRTALDGTVTNTAANGTFGGLDAPLNQTGGGGGYYSGGSSNHGGAGGGSSYISGHTGCNSIEETSTASSITHTGKVNHYSNRSFNNTNMKSGDETIPTHDGSSTMNGNTGNGYAKITAIMVDNGKPATNLIKNSSFENGSTNWSLSNAEVTTTVSKTGASSLLLKPSVTAMSTQSMPVPTDGHIYYGSIEFLSSSTFTTGDNRFEWILSDAAGPLIFAKKSNKATSWTKLSSRLSKTSPQSGNWMIRNFLVNANENAYTDDLFIIDLTETYGAGNEPSKEWCDTNINYFEGTGIVPSY